MYQTQVVVEVGTAGSDVESSVEVSELEESVATSVLGVSSAVSGSSRFAWYTLKANVAPIQTRAIIRAIRNIIFQLGHKTHPFPLGLQSHPSLISPSASLPTKN